MAINGFKKAMSDQLKKLAENSEDGKIENKNA
jgi:hypothetical protein